MSKKRIDIRVIGQATELKEFINICKVIQRLGQTGSSRTFKISVDGDGSGYLRFQGIQPNGDIVDFNSKGMDVDKLDEMDLSIGE